MITHHAFPIEPWTIREIGLDLDVLAQSESVFALSNGHIGLRANLDEGEPHGLPGSYLNSVHELRPLDYGEAVYGSPSISQTIVNVANGKLIRLLVDDEPFDVRYGSLQHHERVLDMRAGTLVRHALWTSPAGRQIEVRSTRLVSFTHRGIAAICYDVTPVDAAIQAVVQSDLVANEPVPRSSEDPRSAGAIDAPFEGEMHGSRDQRAVMVHRTKSSGLRVGAGIDHVIECDTDVHMETVSHPNLGRVTVTVGLEPGQTVRLVKFIAYGWSAQRSLPAVEAQVEAALTAAMATGWDGLVNRQREYLDEYWARADVEVDGDDAVQQAVRFAQFHVLQSSARAERRAIPAKGLTGPGYDGHAFWDAETFVLHVLTYTLPDAARDVLRWRHSTLPIARDHAAEMGLAGAAFAWRTITGQECSAYWPAGTAAFHVNADIACAAIRYVNATGDVDFERETGLELIAETARLWMSLGDVDANGKFRIDGVTGPDEYSAFADNNVYTNLMAQWNLRGAAEAAERHTDVAERLGITRDEIDGWCDAAERMTVPYDSQAGIHPQAEAFTEHSVWDFASTPPENYPLLLHYSYRDLYRKQVVKQADLVLAMHLRGDAFTPEQKARNFDYYEALTVRDSSLSAATQAVIAAEVGQIELAHDYLGEAALMDLGDLEHNTRDGVHMASLAGTWIALVAGLAGLRDHASELQFMPRLPSAIRRLAFGVGWRGRTIRVTVTSDQTAYRLDDGGEPVTLRHCGKSVEVAPGEPVTFPNAPFTARPRPLQPIGRAPARRGSA
ncbi:MAG TPA: glycosyl hydrolase family 65 protein [Micromonosporaceae bacterium]|nr:glycosyl hydrolase family 65 protein [Micromonosporaceae bacterium]